jgi:hypothetical protein
VTVAGTVTGEIFGLTEGATSSATDLIVDSYPARLMPPAPPQTIFTGVALNSFTVDATGGITAATYVAEIGGPTPTPNPILNCNPSLQREYDTIEDVCLYNIDAVTGVTYTLVPSILEP